MTLISSGALGLKDAGTNPSSSNLHDTGFSAFSLASDTSFSLNQAYRLYYDGEVNAWEYSNDVLVDGTAYVYKRQSTSAYHDSGHTVGLYSATGYSADIGTALELTGQATQYSSQSYVSGIGLNASSSSSLGSLTSSAQTYTSADGNGRTISDFGLCQNTNSNTGYNQSQNKGNIIWFGLLGLVSNSDSAAFYNMSIYDSSGNGITGLTRASATYEYDGNVSIWTWHNIGDSTMNFVNQGSITRMILHAATSISYTNGIAEEMSGNTNTNNVAMSSYYKGGTYHNTPLIPTSGQIEFSDFYGKARVTPGVHSQALACTYSSSQYFTSSSHAASSNFTFQGYTTRLSALANFNGTSISLTFQAQSGSPIYTNSGWTTIKVWKGQSNNSGSPDVTLYKSNMSFSVANNGTSTATATWSQGGSFSFATYFGTSNTTNFVEIA